MKLVQIFIKQNFLKTFAGGVLVQKRARQNKDNKKGVKQLVLPLF